MAVIKAVSSKAGIGHAIDYVTKKEKTEEKLVSGLHCEPETVKEDNFIKRCADTYEDERGLVIPLEDKDLKEALMNYPQHGVEAIEEIISKKFEQIVFTK